MGENITCSDTSRFRVRFRYFILFIVALFFQGMLGRDLSAQDFSTWKEQAASGFAGGSGSEQDPYLISSAEELAYFGLFIEQVGREELVRTYFLQTDTIDLSGKIWFPLGNPEKPFSGHYDGQNKPILNMAMDNTLEIGQGNYAGLFAVVDSARLENILLSGVSIDFAGKEVKVGALAGEIRNSYLDNCRIDQGALKSRAAAGMVYSVRSSLFWECRVDGMELYTDSVSAGFAVEAEDCMVSHLIVNSWVETIPLYAVGGIWLASNCVLDDVRYGPDLVVLDDCNSERMSAGLIGISDGNTLIYCSSTHHIISQNMAAGFIGEVVDWNGDDAATLILFSLGDGMNIKGLVSSAGFVGKVSHRLELHNSVLSENNTVGVNTRTDTAGLVFASLGEGGEVMCYASGTSQYIDEYGKVVVSAEKNGFRKDTDYRLLDLVQGSFYYGSLGESWPYEVYKRGQEKIIFQMDKLDNIYIDNSQHDVELWKDGVYQETVRVYNRMDLEGNRVEQFSDGDFGIKNIDKEVQDGPYYVSWYYKDTWRGYTRYQTINIPQNINKLESFQHIRGVFHDSGLEEPFVEYLPVNEGLDLTDFYSLNNGLDERLWPGTQDFKGWSRDSLSLGSEFDRYTSRLSLPEGEWNFDFYSCRSRQLRLISGEGLFSENGEKYSDMTLLKGRYFHQYDLPEPVRKDYVFGGWFKATVPEKEVYNSDIVPCLEKDTLYALWSNEIQIRFDDQKGNPVVVQSFFPATPYNDRTNDIYLNSSFPVPQESDDYRFRGWFADKGCTIQVLESDMAPDTSFTLYAGWDGRVTIYFYSGDQYPIEPYSYFENRPYRDASSGNSGLPQPTDSRFVCWSTDGSLAGKISEDHSVPTKDDTLYAVWSEPVTVSFYPQELGLGSRTYQTCYSFGDSRNGGLPQVEGYDAWFSDKECTQRVDDNTWVEAGITELYAKPWQWVRVEFVSNSSQEIPFREYCVGKPYDDAMNPQPGLPYLSANGDQLNTGWYTSSDLSVLVDGSSLASADVKVLYAGWTSVDEVEFYLDGELYATRSYYDGLSYNDRQNPSEGFPYVSSSGGKDFESWFLDENLTQPVQETDIHDATVNHLYGKWRDRVEMVFMKQGSVYDTRWYSVGIPYYQTNTSNNGMPVDPRFESGVFMGWYAEEQDGSNDYTRLYPVLQEDMVGENIDTLYAHVTTNKPVVFVDITRTQASGSSGMYQTRHYYHSIPYEGSRESAVNTGLIDPVSDNASFGEKYMVFRAWSRHMDNLKQPLTPSDRMGDDEILYARWGIWVRFEENGGDSIPDAVYTPGRLYQQQPNTGLPVGYRNGYLFEGWYRDAGLTQKVEADDTVFGFTHTLYASWTEMKPDEVLVRFETNGSAPIEDRIYITEGLRYGENPNPGLPQPSWEGHLFGGWFSDRLLTKEVNDATVVPDTSHTLYALWNVIEPDKVCVHFDPRGGIYVPDGLYQPLLAYGQSPNPGLPSCERKGFDFVGWYSDTVEWVLVDNQILVPDEDHTLYAAWDAVDPGEPEPEPDPDPDPDFDMVLVRVSFENTGNSLMDDLYYYADGSLTYSTSPNTGLPEPEWEGRIFIGWYSEDLGQNVNGETVVPQYDHVLQARWKSETGNMSGESSVGIRIYPNPGKTGFYLESDVAIMEVYVLRMDGARVATVEGEGGNKLFLDLSEEPTGSYLIWIETEVGIFRKIWVKF